MPVLFRAASRERFLSYFRTNRQFGADNSCKLYYARALQRKTGRFGQRGFMGRPRYECIQEPAGTWKVWDNALNRAAELDGQQLVNRSLFRAEAACQILNRIHLGSRF